ncbi:MAG: FAD-binding oxidoreductase [Planctomycetota bacterium]
MVETDVLIVGQGLAGSALAWVLAERGASFVVVDRGGTDDWGRPSASRVAAGLITPITGKRLAMTPGWPRLWAAAEALYLAAEAKTGRRFLRRRRALRLLPSEMEQERLGMRLDDPRYAGHLGRVDPTSLPAQVTPPGAACWLNAAARLNTAEYLAATRAWLAATGRYLRAEVNPDADVEVSSMGVRAGKIEVFARCVALCQGYCKTPPRRSAPLRLAPAKGEVLTIDAPELALETVTHGGVWVAPESGVDTGKYRVGATHSWDPLDSRPTRAGLCELTDLFKRLSPVPFRVDAQEAGVRPATSDRRPVAEVSPSEPRVAWINGLGAKGALWAPAYAAALAERLAGLGLIP